MLILGIETTCDETAAAVFQDGRIVLSNVVSSQIDLHAKFGGVVPEVAARAHLESLNQIIQQALAAANITNPSEQLAAIAVANCPGLIGCLLVGVAVAKALAFSWQKPLIAVNHVQAHLYSVMLGSKDHSPSLPAIGLVMSGGHSSLYHVTDFQNLSRIGQTQDDAVGEAFDKVAAILQLGYPGGPLIDALAKTGNPHAIPFPQSLLEKDSLDFSFSGIKTAVLYHVNGKKGRERTAASLTTQQKADVAASFQFTAAKMLIEKLRRAHHQFPPNPIPPHRRRRKRQHRHPRCRHRTRQRTPPPRLHPPHALLHRQRRHDRRPRPPPPPRRQNRHPRPRNHRDRVMTEIENRE